MQKVEHWSDWQAVVQRGQAWSVEGSSGTTKLGWDQSRGRMAAKQAWGLISWCQDDDWIGVCGVGTKWRLHDSKASLLQSGQ